MQKPALGKDKQQEKLWDVVVQSTSLFQQNIFPEMGSY